MHFRTLLAMPLSLPIRSLVPSASRLRTWLVPLVMATAALAGCGGNGSSSSGQATVRALNLASDQGALSLLADDTELFSGVAADGLSGDTTLATGTYSLKVRSPG
ncbi:MAG: hypothetical protein U0837_18655, partial [Dehalococcoidia bacterium]